jgi:hypothetical protein
MKKWLMQGLIYGIAPVGFACASKTNALRVFLNVIVSPCAGYAH